MSPGKGCLSDEFHARVRDESWWVSPFTDMNIACALGSPDASGREVNISKRKTVARVIGQALGRMKRSDQ